MELWLVSFVTAVFLSLLWLELPSIILVPIFLVFAMLFLLRPTTRWINGFLLGIIWIASVGHWQLHWQPPVKHFQQTVQVSGKVASLIRQDDVIRFNLRVSKVGARDYWLKPLYRLSLYEYDGELNQGDKLVINARLKPIHGFANQGGFHYQQWLFSQGIVATGYVQQIEQITQANPAHIRQWLASRFYQLQLGQSKWLAALSFGDRSLFEQEDWQLVQHTGIAHLVAISGLHLSIVAGFSYVLFAGFYTLFIARLTGKLGLLQGTSANQFGVLAALLLSMLYAIVAGASIPTLRAWIMLFVLALLVHFNTHWCLRKYLSFCLFLFLLLFPLSIFSLSFWLSFSAITAVWYVIWRWPPKKTGFNLTTAVVVAFRAQLLICVLLIPLVACQFSLLSWSSPLINLIAVPFVTLLLLPLCLGGLIALCFSIPLAQRLFAWADWLVLHGLNGLTWLHENTALAAHVSAAPFVVWLFAALALVICSLPKLPVSRAWASLLFLPVISYQFTAESEDWQVDVLDVGQGLTVVIRKNHRAMVYDVGPIYPSGFNMAEAVLLPFLQAKGIAELDYVFISHGDNDHSGSLSVLQDKIAVKQLLTNNTGCDQSLKTRWQGLEITGLWPQLSTPIRQDGNDQSCALMISDRQSSVFLPGDISKSSEIELVYQYASKLKADLLLAPHHGSNTSSAGTFVAAVAPKYVVFSQGFMNRWGFPKQAVIERYQRNSRARLFSTSESGQVSFLMRANGQIDVTEFRKQIYPYWYAN